MAALSIVLLFFGSVVWIFAYVVPIITGLIVYLLKSSAGNHSAFITYISVSILSVILLPDKECALMYALFFGYYPLIKFKIDTVKNFFIRIVLKLLVFNISLLIVELICVYLFNIPFDDFMGKWGIIIMLALFNIVFLLYDRLFIAFNIIFEKKLSKFLFKYLK